VAGSGLLLDHGFLAAGVFGIVGEYFEGMQVDVAVRAVAGAQAAADAPVFDDDFERIAAAGGADRTADHAERTKAIAAGRGDEVIVETQTVTNETRDTVVGVGAGVHAGIAARAVLQVKNEQALRFHQSLGKELIERNAFDHLQALLVGSAALIGNFF